MNHPRNTLTCILLGAALVACSPKPQPPATVAVPVLPVSTPGTAVAASPVATTPQAPVKLFDGRLLDGKTSLPGPSLADLPMVEEEVKRRAQEPFLQNRLGGDTLPNSENFEARMGLEGSFTRPGAAQKAFFYRLSLLNGLIVVEDGEVIAHFVGSPGDYALYTNVIPVDANMDGLTDLVLTRNVEDNEHIYAYLFLAGPAGFAFSGETEVYTSNVQAGEESPANVEATAYVASVTPGRTPLFQRETYARKGSGDWVLSSPLAPFNLTNRYSKGDEPKLERLAAAKDGVDPASQTQLERVQAALDRLTSYTDVASSIDISNPRNEAERIVIADPELSKMELLDTRAAVYAVENATGQEVDRKDAGKYALSLEGLQTAEEIRLALMKHTNDSLGGESPYTQGLTEGQP